MWEMKNGPACRCNGFVWEPTEGEVEKLEKRGCVKCKGGVLEREREKDGDMNVDVDGDGDEVMYDALEEQEQ